MRALFLSVLGYFLTPIGLVVIAILDASVVFFLPLGVDFCTILMTARKPDLFWLYMLLATMGSVVGAALTYWLGRKIGEHGLSRFVKPRRLERARAALSRGAGLAVPALAIIPPPFPFTPFVLTAGAIGVSPPPFFSVLAGARFVRFAAETLLAVRYGSQIVDWMETPLFKAVVGTLIGLAVLGTIASAVALYRTGRAHRQTRTA
jgi:membrane protein YqaA with SNARE-associated domain